MNFAKTRAAANFIGNDTSGEFIMLNSISNVIHAKSSDISQKQPAANNDALACKNPLIIICMQIINQNSVHKEVWLNNKEPKKRKLGEYSNTINLLVYKMKTTIQFPIIINPLQYNLVHQIKVAVSQLQNDCIIF